MLRRPANAAVREKLEELMKESGFSPKLDITQKVVEGEFGQLRGDYM